MLDSKGFTLGFNRIHAFAVYGLARPCMGVGSRNPRNSHIRNFVGFTLCICRVFTLVLGFYIYVGNELIQVSASFIFRD